MKKRTVLFCLSFLALTMFLGFVQNLRAAMPVPGADEYTHGCKTSCTLSVSGSIGEIGSGGFTTGSGSYSVGYSSGTETSCSLAWAICDKYTGCIPSGC